MTGLPPLATVGRCVHPRNSPRVPAAGQAGLTGPEPPGCLNPPSITHFLAQEHVAGSLFGPLLSAYGHVPSGLLDPRSPQSPLHWEPLLAHFCHPRGQAFSFLSSPPPTPPATRKAQGQVCPLREVQTHTEAGNKQTTSRPAWNQVPQMPPISGDGSGLIHPGGLHGGGEM